jgi:hypothetical protein
MAIESSQENSEHMSGEIPAELLVFAMPPTSETADNGPADDSAPPSSASLPSQDLLGFDNHDFSNGEVPMESIKKEDSHVPEDTLLDMTAPPTDFLSGENNNDLLLQMMDTVPPQEQSESIEMTEEPQLIDMTEPPIDLLGDIVQQEPSFEPSGEQQPYVESFEEPSGDHGEQEVGEGGEQYTLGGEAPSEEHPWPSFEQSASEEPPIGRETAGETSGGEPPSQNGHQSSIEYERAFSGPTEQSASDEPPPSPSQEFMDVAMDNDQGECDYFESSGTAEAATENQTESKKGPMVEEPDHTEETDLVDESLSSVKEESIATRAKNDANADDGRTDERNSNGIIIQIQDLPGPPVSEDQTPSWACGPATGTYHYQPDRTKETEKRQVAEPTVAELPPLAPDSSLLNREPDPASQALIVDLQTSVQQHLNEREAAEFRARTAEERLKQLEAVVEIKERLEEELDSAQKELSAASSERDHLLAELDKLREYRDEHERKQIVLSNRLNAAKKNEAAKVNLAEELQDKVTALEEELVSTREKLLEATAAKDAQEEQMKTTKAADEEGLKRLEKQLADERRLNEERKKKMKTFVESKQEEVRELKAQNDELHLELSQTNRSLREHHSRWKQLHAQWVQSQTRNRELQRDLNRMKKESENMTRMGDQMNVKLSQSAQETEEHKNKRLTAKQELMTVLETLEAERDVSSKLRDSIKFTFTPKALSQQQILRESLRDFEHELVRLSNRLGKPLAPSNDSPSDQFALGEDDEHDETDGSGSGSARKTRSEIDTNHLLSNLEDETQRVSQCIMALTSNIERLHVLIDSSGERSCATLLSDLLMGTTGAGHAVSSGEESASMTGPRRIALGATRQYGQVPTANP